MKASSVQEIAVSRAKAIASTVLGVPMLLAAAMILAPVQAAQAGGLKAQVFLTQAKVPKNTTEKKLIGFARANRARILRESKEEKLDDRVWRASLVVAFNRSVGDLEFQVLFYDVEGGSKRLVEDMSTFVNNRKQKTFVQKIKLPRKRFKPNRKMELVVTVKRQEVARLPFQVIGEEKRHSGRVDFGDDER